MFNFHAKPVPAQTPEPEVNPAAIAATLIEEISAEEEKLASELASILSMRPRRTSSPEITIPEGSHSKFGYEPGNPFDLSNRGFAWRSDEEAAEDIATTGAGEADTPESEDDFEKGIAPPRADAWLKRAKSESRWANARGFASWVLAVLIGGAIVASTVYLLTGHGFELRTPFSSNTIRIF